MKKNDMALTKIREEIDEIDIKIQELIITRAEKIKEVFHAKTQSKDTGYYRPEREANVLKKVLARPCGPLEPKAVASIFRELMSACLALQKPMKIAFLGPEGSFSELAAIRHFGQSLKKSCCQSIAEVFQNVIDEKVDYGVVPIENSIGGLVEDTLNSFIHSPLYICGEVSIPIKSCLLRAPQSNSEIKIVYAHEQSLKQCALWLSKNLPMAEKIPVSSNAFAAKLIANLPDAAAIASEQCESIYGLTIVARNIHDHKNNITRFLIIGRNQVNPSEDDRTTILVKVSDAPGALEKLINPFAKNKINITMIRSKPANPSLSSYYFFLDLDCNMENIYFIRAKQQLDLEPFELKILGSYPKAIL